MNTSLTNREKDDLSTAARQAALNAYAPYSRFRVGAAVLGKNDVYRGANVENASYGLTLCAERSALAKAISEGEREIRAIAIACIDANPNMGIQELMPCGACRQWIVELARDAEIIVVGADHTFAIQDLLPMAFDLGAKNGQA